MAVDQVTFIRELPRIAKLNGSVGDALRLYERLFVAEQDLKHSLSAADEIIDSGMHGHPYNTEPRRYVIQTAITTSMIVTYGRIFTQADGWPKFPEHLRIFSSDQCLVHERLMKLRNEIYAHADSCQYRVQPIRTGDGNPTAVVRKPLFRLEADEVKAMRSLFLELAMIIRSELHSLMTFLEAAVERRLVYERQRGSDQVT